MTDIDEIRQQMAQIRHDMHYDVSHVVSDVEEVMDWRSVVRNHPYILVGVGLAAGYLLVPKSRSRSRRGEQVSASVQPFRDASPATTQPQKPRKSLARQAAGWTMGLIWPLVSQSVQGYAAMWLEDQLKQHMKASANGDSSSRSSGKPEEPYGGEAVYRMPKRG